jgi:peptide/nickel transport system substrate-binding protein
VIFTLESGNADFPFLMSDYHITIQPAGTTNFEDGIGTGGYILQSWEPGVRALVKRNPNYWKEERAHFDEVETIGMTDVNARTNALFTGQIDAMNRCEVKTVHMMKKKPGIQILNVSGTRHLIMEIHCDAPPYDNNNVRLALKYAIDREHILKTALQGYGELGNDYPIGRIQRYHASELPQRTYDPEKAKHYLKKAGLEGHTFKLVVSEAVPYATDSAILYKEHAAKAGINIEVVKISADGYYHTVESGTYSFYWNYWSGRATEDWMFSIAYAEDAPWNLTHFKHERFNKLLKAARAELNEAKRREMYVEMQTIMHNEGGAIIPVFSNWVEAATTKLKIENPAGNWESDGLRCAERWSFA